MVWETLSVMGAWAREGSEGLKGLGGHLAEAVCALRLNPAALKDSEKTVEGGREGQGEAMGAEVRKLCQLLRPPED